MWRSSRLRRLRYLAAIRAVLHARRGASARGGEGMGRQCTSCGRWTWETLPSSRGNRIPAPTSARGPCADTVTPKAPEASGVHRDWEDTADERRDISRVERFAEIVVRAQVQPEALSFWITVGREHHHGHLRQTGVTLDPAEDPKAIQL